MNETDKRLNKVENCVEKNQNKIIQHDKEFERVIGDIKDLKSDRKQMSELLSDVKDALYKLTTTVEKLELRLDYEEAHTKEQKDNKKWNIRRVINFALQILGGLLLAGLIASFIGG